MQGIQLPLGSLPLTISCFENGQVSIQRMANFPTIVDQPEQGIQAIWDVDGGTIGSGTEISYGEMYNYKELPELAAYITAQGMTLPEFGKGN